MKFIVDAQLPPALAHFLATKNEEVKHVLDLQMLEASDSEIWTLALKEDWVIISKDEDFPIRASVSANAPKIIWVRIGNCSKQTLLRIFNDHWRKIKTELDKGSNLVELQGA